jgi:hypothetical protein
MPALSGCNFFWVNLIQIKCGDPQRSSAKCNAAAHRRDQVKERHVAKRAIATPLTLRSVKLSLTE